MTADVTDFLYKYIINNNPFINEEDILSYEALNEHDLLITYKNGKKEILEQPWIEEVKLTQVKDKPKSDYKKLIKTNR